MKLVRIGKYAFNIDAIDYLWLIDDRPSIMVHLDNVSKQIYFDTAEAAEAEFDRVIQYVNHGPSED